MDRTREEYGGFLPLELNNGDEYYSYISEKSIGRFNSGTTALYVAIKSLNKRKVHVPYFYCPTVWDLFKSELSGEYEFCPYYINDNLLPEIDCIDHENEALVLVNYYGIMDYTIYNYVHNKKNIIIDNSQAFFCQPILSEYVYNVYSCRKFIGVSDGAYLIGNHIKDLNLEGSSSIKGLGFVCKSVEVGTNAVYQESKDNDYMLAHERRLMSPLTLAILKNVEYERIREIRIRNFNYIDKRLKKYQKLTSIPFVHSAFCYPLLLSVDLRKKMIENRIYVPTLWKELIKPEFWGRIEYNLSSNCLCLPIDQRYNLNDMCFICDYTEKLIQEV